LVALFIKNYELCEDAEARIFELPNAVEILDKYLDRESLTFDSVDKMFASLQAGKLMKIYLENGGELSDEQQVKLFDLPNADELISILIKREQELCEKAEVMLLKHPNTVQMIDAYTKYTDLSEEAQMSLFTLPNAKELVLNYRKENGLGEEAEAYAQAKGWL